MYLTDQEFNDTVSYITNTSHETAVAAAYTQYQVSLIGTKKHAISKEEFAEMFMENVEDFRNIITRMVEKKIREREEQRIY